MTLSIQATPRLTLISAYAPQATISEEQKTKFYDRLTACAKRSTPHIIGGDFNVRLHRSTRQSAGLGPHTLCMPDSFVHTEDTQSNQSLFLSFLQATEFCATNTLFRRPDAQLHTFIDTVSGTSIQMDFILVHNIWKNGVLNVSTGNKHDLDSDHNPLIANIRFKFQANKFTFTRPKPFPYLLPPSEQQLEEAFTKFKTLLPNHDHADYDTWMQGWITAAHSSFSIKANNAFKTWITPETKVLMQQRALAAKMKNTELWHTLDKAVKKAARRDKQSWFLSLIGPDVPDQHRWRILKLHRAPFQAQSCVRVDAEGNFIPLADIAEHTAKYLAQEHWRPRQWSESPLIASRSQTHGNEATLESYSSRLEHQNRVLLLPIPDSLQQFIRTGNKLHLCILPEDAFTKVELLAALSKLKNSKAQAWDLTQTELLKQLPDPLVENMLGFLNNWWLNHSFPSELTHATVFSLFKKGDVHQLSNYRPIALLSITYKIFTQIIRARIQKAVDPLLSDTQYGFRPKRSTVQPIHILRQLQEAADAEKDSLHLLFLDWEKAFDSLPHQKLIESLALFGFSLPYLKVIASIYNAPTFQVRVGPQTSSTHSQQCGIRQGCPLSPYLFTIIMDVLLWETNQRLPPHFKSQTPRGFPFKHLLYADDTLLLSRSAHHLSTLLQTLQSTAKDYGLFLNLKKTVHIPMNSYRTVFFANGEPVPKELDTVYLGSKFTIVPDPRVELEFRLRSAYLTWKKLFIFWRHSQMPPRLKLIIYHAIIKTKLFYGLETLILNKSQQNLLDAFYLRGLRQIMKMPTTFIDHHYTNQRVYANAACLLAGKFTPTPLPPLSQQWEERRIRWLAFLCSTCARQPEIKATFFFPPSFEFQDVSSLTSVAPRRSRLARRVGRPRGSWVQQILINAWKHLQWSDPSLPRLDTNSQEHRDILHHFLSSRFPFG